MMFGEAVGAWGVSVAGGLSGFAAEVACEAFPLAASLPTRSTLDLGHLCLLAVLRELNFRPHAMHCRSQGGCLATFAASRSLSHLAARLRFCYVRTSCIGVSSYSLYATHYRASGRVYSQLESCLVLKRSESKCGLSAAMHTDQSVRTIL
jgi:hypothetical protein